MFEIPAWILAVLFSLAAVARYWLRGRGELALTVVAVLARVLMAVLYFVVAWWPNALALVDRQLVVRIGLVMLCMAEIGMLGLRAWEKRERWLVRSG